MDAMEENFRNQNSVDIENNLVADAFLAYCKETMEIMWATEEQPFTSTPSEVFAQVTTKAQEIGVNVKNSKRYPQAANLFTRKLNDSKAAIIASGWNYETTHNVQSRVISIWNITKTPEKTITTMINSVENHTMLLEAS